MAVNVSLKRVQITKANTTMVIATAIAAFVFTFTLIAGKALLNKRAYQSRVISGKETAVKQLQTNIKATQTLATAYKAFVSTNDNVIGGNPKGAGDRDGDNAKIVLDALPSQYDFPALTSSLEKILAGGGYKINSISGVDDEVAQQKQSQTQTASPQAVPMPFQVGFTSNISGVKSVLGILEHSIRPMNIQQLDLTGSNAQLQVSVTAQTYYLPEKGLNIETKVVK